MASGSAMTPLKSGVISRATSSPIPSHLSSHSTIPTAVGMAEENDLAWFDRLTTSRNNGDADFDTGAFRTEKVPAIEKRGAPPGATNRLQPACEASSPRFGCGPGTPQPLAAIAAASAAKGAGV